MRRGLTLICVVSAGALCGMPGSTANAATVTAREFGCGKPGCARAFVYEADPGERNQLRIVPAEGGYLFADASAAIRPGPACTAVTEGVHCRFDAAEIGVRLGDGDDRLDASAVAVTLQGDGGPGADELTGSQGPNDLLAGGADQDVLRGGPGFNTLTGDGNLRRVDDGGASLPDAPPARDVMDGGEGGAFVTYAGRRTPVTVDLARGVGGAMGEADALVAVPGAIGGRGDDSLRGTAGGNSLAGGPGRDTINGAAGNDSIDGEDGDDLLRGGSGNDKFGRVNRVSRTKGADRVLCGEGTDSIEEARLETYVAPDCEQVGLLERLNIRLPLRSLSWRAFVLREFFCVDVPCSRTITVRLVHRAKGARAGSLLGRSVFRAGADRRARNLRGVRFTRLGRRILRDRGSVLVRVRIGQRDSYGARETDGFTTRLALRGR